MSVRLLVREMGFSFGTQLIIIAPLFVALALLLRFRRLDWRVILSAGLAIFQLFLAKFWWGARRMLHQPYRYKVEEMDKRIPRVGAALIHRMDEQPCPAGRRLVPDAFTLGSQYWDGCLNELDHSHTVDFVLPGETANFDR